MSKFELLYLSVILSLLIKVAGQLYGDEVLETDQKTWDVGVAAYFLQSDDGVLLNRISTLSQIIYDEIDSINTHKLTNGEKYLLAEKAIEKAKMQSIETLQSLYDSQDDGIFKLDPESGKISERRKITDEHEKLEKLKQTEYLSVAIPDSLDVNFRKSNKESNIWSIEKTDPEIFRQKNTLDMLITINLVRVGDYLGLSSYVWSKLEKITLFEGAISEDEFTQISADIAVRARNMILGRSWAALEVFAQPSNATISVNGELKGVGHWKQSDLEAEEVTVEVSMSGYKPIIETVQLEIGKNRQVIIELEPDEVKQTIVTSQPPGASVRLGTLWLGLTPLLVAMPDRIMPLTLELEGFKTRTVPFFPDAERLTIPLEMTGKNPEDVMRDSRRKFDNASAWFSISIAPTLILAGISTNFLRMSQSAVTDEDRGLAYTNYQVFAGLAWSSVGVNVGLLVITLVRLGKYLKAVDNMAK